MPAGAAERDSVRFCFNDWPPYASMRGQAPEGISIDILQDAAQRAGLEPSFVELPWNRCLAMVEAGQLDAVMDAARREEFLQGDISHTIYTNTIWVRADNPATTIDLSDLGDRSIGLISGYNYGEILDGHFNRPNVKKEYSKDDPTNIKKLGFGRVDVIIGDYVVTKNFAQENGLSLKAVLPSHSYDRLYPSFNKNKVVIQRKLNKALRSMMEDGTIDEIYLKAIGKKLSDLVPTNDP